jgi:hypothetical protein
MTSCTGNTVTLPIGHGLQTLLIAGQPMVSLAKAATASASSPSCLNKLDSEKTGNKPGYAAEEGERFDSLPVPAETTVVQSRAEERSTVDRPED